MRHDGHRYYGDSVTTTGRLPARNSIRIGLTVLMLAGLLLATVIPGSEADAEPVEMVAHVVQEGDSLWSVAVAYTSEAGDVRHTMDLIRDANRMFSDVVNAGDAIQVPVKDDPGWSVR